MILKNCNQTIKEIRNNPIKIIYSIDSCCSKMFLTKHIIFYNGQENIDVHVGGSHYNHCPHCGEKIFRNGIM